MGLLDAGPLSALAHQRPCLRCRTPMVLEDGLWKLDQVDNVGFNLSEGPKYKPSGLIFTANLYRCPSCKTVELVDSE